MVSSLEQSPAAMTTLSLKLQSNPEFASTAYVFEDLLFHRMRREWGTMASLSASLEIVQQAHVLGMMDAFSESHSNAYLRRRSLYSFTLPASHCVAYGAQHAFLWTIRSSVLSVL
jgi:hypothetical protein